MNKKKLLLIIIVLVALFALSGCAVPTKNGKVVLITDDTTFKYMFDNEGFFAAIFVYPFTKAINFISKSTNSVFLGIALVTLLVNLAILALTWKSNISQQKMQALQPEMAKIQKKYEGKTDQASKMRQGQEIQQLYAKHGVNPLGTFASLFIQFPVMIAVYHATMRSEQVANGKLLGLNLQTTPLGGVSAGQYGYAIIFIVMAILQIVSMKLPQYLSEKRAKEEAERQFKPYKKTPQPAQNFMFMMIGIVLFFGLTWASSMSIYWAITSAIAILKTLIIDKYLKRS